MKENLLLATSTTAAVPIANKFKRSKSQRMSGRIVRASKGVLSSSNNTPDSKLLSDELKSHSGSGFELGVPATMAINVFASVLLVALNKILFRTLQFPFVTLLSAAHFLTGWLFLTVISSPRFGLFKRAIVTDAVRVWKIAAAGALSIVLSNYSLSFNSLGTAQIFKAAVLPAVIILTVIQDFSRSPSRIEAAAAMLVVCGSCLSVVSDVSTSNIGLTMGLSAVAMTAQYQLWQGVYQKRLGMTPIQLMHASALPQGILTLTASIMLETDWRHHLFREHLSGAADIFTFHFTALQIVVVLATVFLAAALNWSAFAIIGKTSAVTMQVATQVKAVFIFVIDYIIFPRPIVLQQLLGNIVCIGGALWYGMEKTRVIIPISSSSTTTTK
jgi:solute carrier family 35 protein E3